MSKEKKFQLLNGESLRNTGKIFPGLKSKNKSQQQLSSRK